MPLMAARPVFTRGSIRIASGLVIDAIDAIDVIDVIEVIKVMLSSSLIPPEPELAFYSISSGIPRVSWWYSRTRVWL